MAGARLGANGRIVIPAEFRARYRLTRGTRVEFVDEGGVIRLLFKTSVALSDPASGYGMIKVTSKGKSRRLAVFDAASCVRRRPLR